MDHKIIGRNNNAQNLYILSLVRSNSTSYFSGSGLWRTLDTMIFPESTQGNRMTTLIAGNEYHLIGIGYEHIEKFDEILECWSKNPTIAKYIEFGYLVLRTNPEFDELYEQNCLY